jgi:hypothetical protein
MYCYLTTVLPCMITVLKDVFDRYCCLLPLQFSCFNYTFIYILIACTVRIHISYEHLFLSEMIVFFAYFIFPRLVQEWKGSEWDIHGYIL